ncbi:ABC transporter substrate-binding protein [Piscinibacter sp. XHJ-5]|uniref:ABC transporter substrate-binding protein n=1 Tax=Piscinibacter sp. XHJ-5 TaxID=3037797 RepID=UPI0024531034|nr:ABC transporter substrate-binding protein [Piscinibacter sp. XHJ-5]
MKRLHAFVACLVFCAAAGAAPQKVLRYAFLIAETSLDPARINDTYSRTLTPHIFEAPYTFDHLARPVKLKPLTADGMPQHSTDFQTWTIRIRPGIHFADDPAFKGRRRELVAQDYVYSIKRIADPANKSPVWTGLAEEKILGLAELRQQALDQKKPFDYDREIDGLRALDRYTLQVKVAESRPRFTESLADSALLGAVAREVVESYGDRIDEHPVGTGPFRLAQWRRRSFIALERNPDFREMVYDAEPAADDAEGQALLARFKGRRLPMVDRVEISIIEEHQPRWLSFINGEADFIERVDAQFINTAMPGGRVAPNLAKKGVRGYRQIEAGSTYYFFNMDDPTVGGYTPDKVALRRAIGLGLDLDAEIRLLRRGQAVPAQSPVLPHTSGYDPKFKSEFSDHDLPRAKALLDMFGFVDRDGDGWRDMPDGSPLVLRIATEPDQRSRQFDEMTKKDMDALGVRVSFEIAQWPENLKAARAGKLAIWQLGGTAAGSDGQGALARYDSKQIGGQNMARFKNAAFDALMERMRVIEDGAERDALFDQAKRLAVAYMPYKFRVHRVLTDMSYPWLIGYRRPVLWNQWWQYVDIDTEALARAAR